MKPELGVCYYPEHWDEARWAEDARHMVATGICWVRIGEFAWSRLEPKPGALTFAWLDRAIACLGEAGLKVVLGTPTATPPIWMLDRYPDMVAVDEAGHPRTFGSRRHYCFSHVGYRDECRRIAQLLGERYGTNPHIHAWQIDNEYGCHETVVSYSEAARTAFQEWLQKRYQTIAALNAAWGNVFWSMDYQAFDQIGLPHFTVTQANPAHIWAFRRFSSDQVVAFNQAQVDVLRRYCNAPLIHNYMGRELAFDHFDVGEDLDIASWDSYPIGFLSDRLDLPESHKLHFLRQGDPDCQAFHHDLYRAVGNGRWWVMEQQPGPVNWAPFNPAPLPGMVSLWALEAFAHGAEVVSYFRWRQAPFAQEQMHAGLLNPDGTPAMGLAEAKTVADQLAELGDVESPKADVAILFDYASAWAWETLPQGHGFDYFNLLFSLYRALRRKGVNIDFIPPDPDQLKDYSCVFAPGLAAMSSDLEQAMERHGGLVVLGPRAGAITDEFQIPLEGRPSISSVSVNVELVETVPPTAPIDVKGGGAVQTWFERVRPVDEAVSQVHFRTIADEPLVVAEKGIWYLAGWPDDPLWDRVVSKTLEAAGIETVDMPEGLRRRQTKAQEVLINYESTSMAFKGQTIGPCSVLFTPLQS